MYILRTSLTFKVNKKVYVVDYYFALGVLLVLHVRISQLILAAINMSIPGQRLTDATSRAIPQFGRTALYNSYWELRRD